MLFTDILPQLLGRPAIPNALGGPVPTPLAKSPSNATVTPTLGALNIPNRIDPIGGVNAFTQSLLAPSEIKLREAQGQLAGAQAQYQQARLPWIQDPSKLMNLLSGALGADNSGGDMPDTAMGRALSGARPSGGGGGANTRIGEDGQTYWTPSGLDALQPTEGRWDQIHYPSGRTKEGVKSSASGGFGYLDSTWQTFAPQAGVDITKWPRAYMAPEDVQRRVALITPIHHWTGVDAQGKPFNAQAQKLAANPAYTTTATGAAMGNSNSAVDLPEVPHYGGALGPTPLGDALATTIPAGGSAPAPQLAAAAGGPDTLQSPTQQADMAASRAAYDQAVAQFRANPRERGSQPQSFEDWQARQVEGAAQPQDQVMPPSGGATPQIRLAQAGGPPTQLPGGAPAPQLPQAPFGALAPGGGGPALPGQMAPGGGANFNQQVRRALGAAMTLEMLGFPQAGQAVMQSVYNNPAYKGKVAEQEAYGKGAGGYPWVGPTEFAKGTAGEAAKFPYTTAADLYKQQLATITEANKNLEMRPDQSINVNPNRFSFPAPPALPAPPGMAFGGGAGGPSPFPQQAQAAPAAPMPAPAGAGSAATPIIPVPGDSSTGGENFRGRPSEEIKRATKRAESEEEDRQKVIDQGNAALATDANIRNMQSVSEDFIRGAGAEGYQTLARLLRVVDPTYDKQVASYEQYSKDLGQLTRTAVRETSSRAAVQEFKLIGDTLPTPSTSPEGMARVLNEFRGLNNFRLAKMQAQKQWEANNKGSTAGFETDFANKSSPYSFVVSRMDPKARADVYAKLNTSAEGRRELALLSKQLQYIHVNHLEPY